MDSKPDVLHLVCGSPACPKFGTDHVCVGPRNSAQFKGDTREEAVRLAQAAGWHLHHYVGEPPHTRSENGHGGPDAQHFVLCPTCNPSHKEGTL